MEMAAYKVKADFFFKFATAENNNKRYEKQLKFKKTNYTENELLKKKRLFSMLSISNNLFSFFFLISDS